jgi:CPA1 family monovalent cation:H+ antiporter
VQFDFERMAVLLLLRGLTLALVVSIPESVPQRDEIVAMGFAVVAYSVFVQGITIAPWPGS